MEDQKNINETNENGVYEVSFWIPTEDASGIKGMLEHHKASIISEKPLVKGRLAYPIQKEQYAFFGTFRFEIAPELIAPISNDLKLEKNIIRSFLHRVNLQQEAAAKRAEGDPSKRRAKRGTREFGKKPEGDSLTNEAIEKKIEEILQ